MSNVVRVLAIRRSVAWISSSMRGVDRRRGVVEQQDRRVGEERARERDALPLTTRQRQALLTDDCLVAVRELHDEFVGFGGAGRGLDFGRGRVGAPERDVRGDRVGEEERVLEHHADAAAQRLQRRVAHVEPVDLDRTGVNVVEPRQQQPDRRLARARATDERDGFTRGNVQREVAQHRLGRGISERDVVEVDRTPLDVQHLGVGLVLHVRCGVEQVVDALRAGPGELTDGQDGRELADRRRDEQHVRREGEERSERDLVVQGEPAAERQHRDLTERGDRLHRGLQASLDVHQPHARREHQLGAFGQAVELARLLPEPLHDADAGDVFLDDVGDVARLLLRVPTRREHRRAQLHRGDEQERRDREHHQRERYRQDEHDGQRHDEQQDVRHADRQELQETLYQRHVGRRAADELTRRHFVVAGEVEALQLPEDRGAEIVLNVERDAAAPETAQVREDEREHAHHDHQRQPRRQRPLVVRDDVVDHDLLHERQQRLDQLAADGHAERDVRVLLVRLHVADEAADPTLLLHLLGGHEVGHLGGHLASALGAQACFHPQRERVVEIEERAQQRVALAGVLEDPDQRLAHLVLGGARARPARPE